MKYKILTLFGLKAMLANNHGEVYSPDGYPLMAVNNGLMGGELLYDYEKKKVYGVVLKEIPDLTEKDIEYFDHQWARENIKFHMGAEDMLKIIKEKEKKNGR